MENKKYVREIENKFLNGRANFFGIGINGLSFFKYFVCALAAVRSIVYWEKMPAAAL